MAPLSDPRPPGDEAPTAWSPLRNRAFRELWIAWFLAGTCMLMCEVAAAWLMTTLTTQSIVVALVQTAATLPVCLLALPSGAMADIVDRRRWYLGTQLWTGAIAALLAFAAATHRLSAPVLLALIFANGVGMALRWPAFAAIIPELMPRREVPQALALQGVAVNSSRIFAPLAAGLLLVLGSATLVFAVGMSMAAVAAVLVWRWHYVRPASAMPAEPLLGAMRVGLQYVRQSPPVIRAMARIFVLFVHTSALLALLPLVAKGLGSGDAHTYTMLFSCMGVGAIAVALLLPRLRREVGAQPVLVVGMVLLAVGTTVVAVAPGPALAAPALIVVGAAWLAVGNSVNVSAQMALPDWARARGMAIFLTATMAGGACGATVFGVIAEASGVRASLLLLSVVSLASLVLLRRHPLETAGGQDLEPAPAADRPPAPDGIAPGDGPVVVTIEYEIDPEDLTRFVEVMQRTRRARLRGGAMSWSLLRDAGDSRRAIETFVDPNWLEHLRRVDRLNASDAVLREQRLALHRGTGVPRVTRYIGQRI